MSEIEMPLSFDMNVEGWGPWALVHGVPPLPAAVGVDEAVPVAQWTSDRWAAIVYLSYRKPDLEDGELEASLDTETQSYRWDDGAWVMASGSGGTGWPGGLELARPAFVGASDAVCMHQGLYSEDGWSCRVVDGIAGTDATSVEVEQQGRLTRCALNSPLGVWVAAFDGRVEATVRVRTGDRAIFECVMSP